jgi:hypothetical protein
VTQLPAHLLLAARSASERDLSDAIRELAARYGYLAYHTFDSRKSAPGFPDWILVKHGIKRNGRLVALELKTERGQPTPEQLAWIGALSTIPGCDARIIRPSGLQAAADLLAGKR